jgi:hypothetical protein
MKNEVLKAACLEAAATMWVTGQLNQSWHSAQSPEAHAEIIAEFAAKLYKAWGTADPD